MTQDDTRNLDLLATFHYVAGGITALFFCFPLIHVALGLAMIVGGTSVESGSGEQTAAALLGWLFFSTGLAIGLTGWAISIAIILAGRKLKARKSWTFCMVVAGVECMMMPYGTVLGVLTLILLNKPGVRDAFETAGAGSASRAEGV